MPSDKGTVHIIDDDDALRESLAFLLRTARIEVATYSSSAAFLEEIPDAKLNCVITDVRMPGMSGIDLLKRLREMKLDVPVIVITGHGDVPLAVEAMKIGAIDFLEKRSTTKFCWQASRPPSSARAAISSAMPNARKSRTSWPLFPTASAMCSARCWRDGPTSRSPSISASVRAQSRSTEPIS